MPVTRQQVERMLDVEEPDYAAAARLGPGALPHLEAIAHDAGPALAAKATYLASLIGGDTADRIVDAASRRSDPVVRVTAAAALGRISEGRLGDIAARLLLDSEGAVRQRALHAIPRRTHVELQTRLSEFADTVTDDRRREILDALRKVR